MLHPGICSELRQGVRDGTFDVAIILDGLQTHPDLICANLGEEEVVVVAAPDHRLAGKERIEAADFAGENWIFTEAGCSYRSMMEKVLADSQAASGTSMEFGSLEAIKQCVAYGLGIALLPKIAVREEVQKGKLAILPFSHPEIRVYRQLVYHRKKWMPQALHRFFELLSADNDVQSDNSV
jgi:DNA-binding transcriptional LysR family regulator